MKNGMNRKGENIGKSRVFGHTFQTFRKFQKKYIPPETFCALPFCKIFLRWVYVFVPECGILECGGRKPLQHKEKWHSGNIPEWKKGDKNRNEEEADEKGTCATFGQAPFYMKCRIRRRWRWYPRQDYAKRIPIRPSRSWGRKRYPGSTG